MDLRELILDQEDTAVEPVEVPEWRTPDGKPVVVYLRAITGTERDAFEEGSLRKVGKRREVTLANVRARLVVLAAVKSPTDLSPLFKPTDAAALGGKGGKALTRLYDVAARLAGITDEDIEELVGNSGSGPNAASGSN